MAYRTIKISINDSTGILTFNRPKVLNALNIETLKETKQAVLEFAKNVKVKVIILTGEQKAFIAGADIAEMKQMSPTEARKFSELGHDLMDTLHAKIICGIKEESNKRSIHNRPILELACQRVSY
jgi:enoyl-CoA hydratase